MLDTADGPVRNRGVRWVMSQLVSSGEPLGCLPVVVGVVVAIVAVVVFFTSGMSAPLQDRAIPDLMLAVWRLPD